MQRAAPCQILCPSRQALGRRIDERDVGIGVGGDHGIADAGERGCEPLLLAYDFKFNIAPLRDIFYGQQNQSEPSSRMEPPGIEEHRAPADAWEFFDHLVIVKVAVSGQNLFEQFPQGRNIPLPVPQLVKQSALCFLRGDLERAEKLAAGLPDAKFSMQHQQGLADHAGRA